VLNEKIKLSPEEIVEKEFKIDAKGYRPQEVDHFLDEVIMDYTEFTKMIRRQAKEIKALEEEIENLKKENRSLETKLDSKPSHEEEVSNLDIMRRLSQLEKIVYSKFNRED